MSDLRQWSHDFFREFIEVYRSYPCLWQVKSSDYSDREKKNQAYAVLVKKCQEVDPTATKDTVTKKINSFRSVYRKELQKVNKSARSGAGTDDIYKPSLWYFKLLSFLNDQETPRETISNLEDNDLQEQETDNELALEEREEHSVSELSLPPTPTTAGELSTFSRATSSSSNPLSSTIRKRKQRENNDNTSEVLQLAGEKLKTLRQEDSFDVFGKHIANKLRGLTQKQNIFAQKLINDVVFQAEMEALNKDFRVICCDLSNTPCREQRGQMSTGFSQQFLVGSSDANFYQQRVARTSSTEPATDYPNYSASETIGHYLNTFDGNSS